ATSSGGSGAELAVDGNPATAWRGTFGGTGKESLTLDLGHAREFGGLVLQWQREYASDYSIQLSNDGSQWREVRSVLGGNGGRDWIALPESEARYLRLNLVRGHGNGYALAEATIEPLAFAADPNAFVESIAKASPRGWYPRGFSGEQPYWTIVGIDGGKAQGLIGEDGAIEVARGGFSIEPFVVSDRKLVTWADVNTSQSLQDGDLPIPSVHWTHPDFALAITASAQGSRERSQLIARYRLTNTTSRARDYVVALALRPLQVNPPSQFLKTQGGVSAIHQLALNSVTARIDGNLRIRLLTPADAAFATVFDAGMAVEHIIDTDRSAAAQIADATGLASGAWRYHVHLAPGESRDFAWGAALSGALPQRLENVAAAQQSVAADWRSKLDQVRIQVPPAAQHLVDTLHTAQANMLISRDGPRLQPGTRSYARAWIRDGAMISEALLRMGRADVAEDFLRWYAPHRFDNGKVPCCVDDRGSDPVPENDSHGELLFTIAQVYRYTQDRKLLEDMWPHVLASVNYMDTLRLSERTEANHTSNPAFYGMMPASISHEGYSAKPMHSYWDDFWSMRGYDDAVQIAQWLGHDDDAKRFAASRDQFREDLQASIAAAVKLHGIDYLPGAAELGDFDATSSTIALTPGNQLSRLPQSLIEHTFERYWRDFIARRDGTRAWKDYTPYELRTVGAFVRLGWRDRALQALDFFLADQQPRGWNQWAEVVSHTPRKPFFLGDLPHAWVASDYVCSVLDMFAYDRTSDESLVIAAGLPANWLQREGVSIAGLRTPYGVLGYRLRRESGRVSLDLDSGIQIPPGGIVLQLPHQLVGGTARIDGVIAAWHGYELRIDHVPAQVLIEVR
ncbi:MAG: discoidin domain-containing protein, partial [Lysobacteraceae bacterium]